MELLYSYIRKTEENYSTTDLPKGDQHILFIDDEHLLVEVGREMLEELGYKVTFTSDTTEAIEFFKKNYKKIDLVITDLTMPKMTGDQVAEKLLTIQPDVKIILCTGYLKNNDINKYGEGKFKLIMKKPIALNTLAQSVRDILDS